AFLKRENGMQMMFRPGLSSILALVLMGAIPSVLAQTSADSKAVSQQVTFSREIAPIIYRNCALCHRSGESAPFSLLSYEDVKRHARQIAEVTKRRYMPPFLPEPGYGDFLEERRLSDREISLIQEWVKAGSPEGPRAKAPPAPKFASEWPLGTPD